MAKRNKKIKKKEAARIKDIWRLDGYYWLLLVDGCLYKLPVFPEPKKDFKGTKWEYVTRIPG